MGKISQKIIPELKITDFKNSIHFYTKLAQFKIEYDRPEDEFAMLSREGAWLMIESISDKSRTFNVGETEYPLGRGINLEIEVSDVQGLCDNFKNNSYPLFLEMEEKWYRKEDIELGNKQFLVQDPDGYLLRFSQDLGTRSLSKS